MALLNSRNNNFLFYFPKGWLFPAVIDRFQKVVDRFDIPFATIEDYVNYSIQSVTYPDITVDEPMQSFGDVDRIFKGGYDAKRYTEHNFTVTFKTTEGYLNYWIMRHQWEKYYELGPDNITYLPDLRLGILDHSESLLMTVVFKGIVFSKLSSMDYSYASNLPEFKTFSCDFKFSTHDIIHELD